MMFKRHMTLATLRLALGLGLSLLPVSTVPAGPVVCQAGQVYHAQSPRDGTSLSFTVLEATGLKSTDGAPLCLVWAEEQRVLAGIKMHQLSNGPGVFEPVSGAFAPLQFDDRMRVQQAMGLLPHPLPKPVQTANASVMGTSLAFALAAILLVAAGVSRWRRTRTCA